MTERVYRATNVLGRGAIRLLGGLTLLKSLPLIALAGFALATVPLPAFGPPPPLSATEASILLVFYAFAMQCMSTLAVTYRETKSWRWPLAQLLYMTGLAYAAAFVVYQALA